MILKICKKEAPSLHPGLERNEEHQGKESRKERSEGHQKKEKKYLKIRIFLLKIRAFLLENRIFLLKIRIIFSEKWGWVCTL